MPDGSITPEVKGVLDNLQSAFETFKSENDARLAEIEKGREDPLDMSKVDAISEEIGGLQTKLEELAEAEAKAQTAERLDNLETALARGIRTPSDDDPKLAKSAEAFWLDERHQRNARHAGVEPTAESFTGYLKSYAHYLRKGDKDPELDTKSLSVGVDADGGYWVTPVMLDTIVKRTFETSPIRAIAQTVTIGTDALEFINDTNDATSGGWVGEKDSRAETVTPQIGKTRIPVHEQFANPRITQKLLDDSQFNVEQWLANKIGDKLGRDENVAFVTGNGVERPKGFMDYSSAATTQADTARSWGVLQYVATGSAGGFDTGTVDATSSPVDELVDLQAALKNIYRPNARWVMSRATEAEVRKLRATTGEYLVTLNTGNITGVPLGSFMLLGHPIVQAEDMPAIATNSFSIAFGDFSAGYLIVDRMGIRTLRDPFSAKPFVQFYTTKRVGGDVVDFDAIKLLKFGTS